MSAEDLQAIWLTLKLASIVTIMLLIIATPLAWWLCQTHNKFKGVVGAIVSLPLILPPTVIGFYLLIFFGPQGWGGYATSELGIGFLPFTFTGLVIASIIYSFPFVVQPLQNAFESICPSLLEAASTLRANRWDTFIHIVIPMSRNGFITASILGFAHTVGEFGVVLMMGGNIPGQTRVLSVQIYDHVEAMEFGHAHVLAGGMLVVSFMLLLILQVFRYKGLRHV